MWWTFFSSRPVCKAVLFVISLSLSPQEIHNSRSFFAWDQSTPQRSTAWYGIRMVRDVNNDYLNSLHGVFPPYRLGVLGDVAKVNCNTCHQGAFKPLAGVVKATTGARPLSTYQVELRDGAIWLLG